MRNFGTNALLASSILLSQWASAQTSEPIDRNSFEMKTIATRNISTNIADRANNIMLPSLASSREEQDRTSGLFNSGLNLSLTEGKIVFWHDFCMNGIFSHSTGSFGIGLGQKDINKSFVGNILPKGEGEGLLFEAKINF